MPRYKSCSGVLIKKSMELAKKAKESGAEIRDGVSALSCTEKDGLVEVSLHGGNHYTESARYVLDCEGVVGVLKRKIIGEEWQVRSGRWNNSRLLRNIPYEVSPNGV